LEILSRLAMLASKAAATLSSKCEPAACARRSRATRLGAQSTVGLPIVISLYAFPSFLRSQHEHTYNALDDAIEQAEIFANLFHWRGFEPGGDASLV
jgi:hypothetical protein